MNSDPANLPRPTLQSARTREVLSADGKTVYLIGRDGAVRRRDPKRRPSRPGDRRRLSRTGHLHISNPEG